MTATVPSITVDEYLKTDYSPDCDYVDGFVEERNLGTYTHGRVQLAFLLLIHRLERSHRISVVPEQRLQTGPVRFRIPDVCVIRGRSSEEVLRVAPLLCIEVLSPEDRLSRIEERVQEYLDMGTEFIWIVDPSSREAWTFGAERLLPVTDGLLRTFNPDIEVSLEELWLLADG